MMELVDLSKSYGQVNAVANISLTIEDDEYLTLLGPSGSGKSTLLRLIAGLERPDTGSVKLNGVDLTMLAPHRRGLGIVQQNYALFPHMTVFENVAFGLRWRETDPVTDEREINQRVGAMLDLVGLAELEHRSVGQISGGQKQRVSLARTLVTEPKVCLLDEPLGALDANLRERMTLELRRIRETLGVSFMHVTGNETEAIAMGDRMIVLDEGKAVMAAPPAHIFSSPSTIRVAHFLNAYNTLDGAVNRGVFVHDGVELPMPFEADSAAHYAIRYDAVSIVAADDQSALMQATFIASEFTGGGVTYFLNGPGGVFEVEKHLSRADPIEFATGQHVGVTWAPTDAIVFDRAGVLIETTELRGVA